MSGVNILRAVENIRSGTTVYTPVIELIVNAIQAIRLSKAKGSLVDVMILRSRQTDLEDGIGEVDGFIVSDDGIGFNEQHRNSFDTIYSALKAKDGGKGFGRFTCLKYFENLSVQSVFFEDGRFRARSFNMGTATDIIVNEDVSDTEATATGSQVRIDGIKRTRFPDKGIDTISRDLLPVFRPPIS
ncbi:hypothetical protein CA233_19880 [Sphingomonas sp. ABOLD]|nr:hypothetical protein CA234_19300 [Sphingomonas sp. ABOLE]RSV40392.1 hypothetical protein CA233_19880 [Sphingomonas sp. ABOLD]